MFTGDTIFMPDFGTGEWLVRSRDDVSVGGGAALLRSPVYSIGWIQCSCPCRVGVCSVLLNDISLVVRCPSLQSLQLVVTFPEAHPLIFTPRSNVCTMNFPRTLKYTLATITNPGAVISSSSPPLAKKR